MLRIKIGFKEVQVLESKRGEVAVEPMLRDPGLLLSDSGQLKFIGHLLWSNQNLSMKCKILK